MRRMHPIIIECVERLKNALDKEHKKNGNNEIQLKKMMSGLTLDVIFCCAFATQIDIYSDSTNEFVTNARKVFQGGWRLWLFYFLLISFPKLIEWTGFKQNDPEASSFFRDTVILIIFIENHTRSYLNYIYRSVRL